MPAKRDRSFAADSPVGSYWLGHCVGFYVRGFRRSGTVEEIVVHPDGRVQGLGIRRRSFVRSRLIIVPIESVASVNPWDEMVVLAGRRTGRARAAEPAPTPIPVPVAAPRRQAAEPERAAVRPPLPVDTGETRELVRRDVAAYTPQIEQRQVVVPEEPVEELARPGLGAAALAAGVAAGVAAGHADESGDEAPPAEAAAVVASTAREPKPEPEPVSEPEPVAVPPVEEAPLEVEPELEPVEELETVAVLPVEEAVEAQQPGPVEELAVEEELETVAVLALEEPAVEEELEPVEVEEPDPLADTLVVVPALPDPEEEPEIVPETAADEELVAAAEPAIAAAVALGAVVDEPTAIAAPAKPAGPSAARVLAGRAAAAVAAFSGRVGARLRPAAAGLGARAGSAGKTAGNAGRVTTARGVSGGAGTPARAERTGGPVLVVVHGAGHLARRATRGLGILALLTLELAARAAHYAAVALVRGVLTCRALAVAAGAWLHRRVPAARHVWASARGAFLVLVVLGTRAARNLAFLGMRIVQAVLRSVSAATAAGTAFVASRRQAAPAGAAPAASPPRVPRPEPEPIGTIPMPEPEPVPTLPEPVPTLPEPEPAPVPVEPIPVAAAPEPEPAPLAELPQIAAAAPLRSPERARRQRPVQRAARPTQLPHPLTAEAPDHVQVTPEPPQRQPGPIREVVNRWRASRRWQDGRPEPINAQYRPRRDIDLPPGVKVRRAPREQHTPVGPAGSPRDQRGFKSGR